MRLMERWRCVRGVVGCVCVLGGLLEDSWIWLSVYACLRTSWRHKCQLWAVCGLPTKLLAQSAADWFYLLDSWHAKCKLWPSMCHSNAMASQTPHTSVLMDIRVNILQSYSTNSVLTLHCFNLEKMPFINLFNEEEKKKESLCALMWFF